MAENNMFELKIISPEEMFYEGEASFWNSHLWAAIWEFTRTISR